MRALRIGEDGREKFKSNSRDSQEIALDWANSLAVFSSREILFQQTGKGDAAKTLLFGEIFQSSSPLEWIPLSSAWIAILEQGRLLKMEWNTVELAMSHPLILVQCFRFLWNATYSMKGT